MEFIRVVDKQVTADIIQDEIHPESIQNFTETMLFLENNNTNFKGETLWGAFSISYHKINGGIRFTLLDCPNALAWTITTGFPPERNKIMLHCTINRTQKPTEFVEEINEFLDEWEAGLVAQF